MAPDDVVSMRDANGQSDHAPEVGGLSKLDDFLALHPGIRFLRLQWQDMSGILRARVVPIEVGRAMAAGKKTIRSFPNSLSCVVENSLMPTATLLGATTGLPDWDSLQSRPSLDLLYATVMCQMVRHSPKSPAPNGDHCPRRALATIVDKAFRLFQMQFLVGFEVEFEVMKRTAKGEMTPHSLGLGASACAGLRDPCYAHVEEAMQVLLQAGVGLEAVHSEGVRGQYEFVLGPRPPLQAVDELVLVHDTLKRVFARHELVATVFPRPVPSRSQSNGQHTHVSIHPPHMEDNFLAGILQKLPGLCALCLPYNLSYERIKPLQAGDVVSWGTENRGVPIRRIKPGHWEMRFVDATANMYLALAAILGAGLIGYENRVPLLIPDMGIDPGATEHGGHDSVPLPRTLSEALDRLVEDSSELDAVMQGKALHHYLSLKRFEASRLHDMGVEEARLLLTELF